MEEVRNLGSRNSLDQIENFLGRDTPENETRYKIPLYIGIVEYLLQYSIECFLDYLIEYFVQFPRYTLHISYIIPSGTPCRIPSRRPPIYDISCIPYVCHVEYLENPL